MVADFIVGTPKELALWFGFLFLQNMAFTFVSRARNSGSYLLHALASLPSNGIYFVNLFISMALYTETIKSGSMGQRVFLVAFYCVPTMLGSVFMHWVGRTHIETRIKGGKVGA